MASSSDPQIKDDDDDDHLPISILLKNRKNGDNAAEDDDRKNKKRKKNVENKISRVRNTRRRTRSKGLKEESDHEPDQDDDDDDDVLKSSEQEIANNGDEIEVQGSGEVQELSVGNLVWVKSSKHKWRPGWIDRRGRGSFHVSLFENRNPRIVKCKASNVCCFERNFSSISKSVGFKPYFRDVPDFAADINEALRELRKQFMAGVKCPCRGSSMPAVNVERKQVKRNSKELAFQPTSVLRFVLAVAVYTQFDLAEYIYTVRHVSQCLIFRRYIYLAKDWKYRETMGFPSKYGPTDDDEDDDDSEVDPWRDSDEEPEKMEMEGLGPVPVNQPSDHGQELETSNADIAGKTLAEKGTGPVNGDGFHESQLIHKDLNKTNNDGVVGFASDATKKPLLSSHVGDHINIHSSNKACKTKIRTDKQVSLGMDAKGGGFMKGASPSETVSRDPNCAYPDTSVGIATGATSKSLLHLGDIPKNHPSEAATDKLTNRVVGSKMVSEERLMEKTSYSRPDSDLSYIQREQLDSAVPVDLPLSSSIPPFQYSEASHVDKGARLDIRFPREFNLPSKDELVKQFSQFGPLDAPASKVFSKTHSAQVVFLRKLDAEVARDYARSNNIPFGGAEARIWIAGGHKDLRQGTAKNTSPESLPTVGSSALKLKSAIDTSDEQCKEDKIETDHENLLTEGPVLSSSAPTTEDRALTPPEPGNHSRDSKPDISRPFHELLTTCGKLVCEILGKGK